MCPVYLQFPAARNGPRHVRELQAAAGVQPGQAALRRRPDRHLLPQRDLAALGPAPRARVRAGRGGALLRPRRQVAPALRRPPAPPDEHVLGLRPDEWRAPSGTHTH